MLKVAQVFENDNGWKPSNSVVSNILTRLKRTGFRSDWEFCHATNRQGMLFNDASPNSSSIVVVKDRGVWKFYLD
jgi:hypothetical protein